MSDSPSLYAMEAVGQFALEYSNEDDIHDGHKIDDAYAPLVAAAHDAEMTLEAMDLSPGLSDIGSDRLMALKIALANATPTKGNTNADTQ